MATRQVSPDFSRILREKSGLVSQWRETYHQQVEALTLCVSFPAAKPGRTGAGQDGVI